MELHLIGVDHCDPSGPRRLRKLLKEIAPDNIALEFTKAKAKGVDDFYSLPLRSRKARFRIPGVNERTLEFYCRNLWFEYRTAQAFDVPLAFVDTWRRKHIHGQNAAREAAAETFCSSLSHIRKTTETEYADPQRTYDYWMSRIGDGFIRESQKRDAVMEREVRRLDGVVAFPVGYGHILWPYHNLAVRFADINPRIWLLPDADRL